MNNGNAARRQRTENALLTAGAANIARFGYAELVLERVARDAGYTRGALYHLFANKDALVLAVVEWVGAAWRSDMGLLLADSTDPLDRLISAARRSAVYSRQEPARALSRLRPEFAGTNHPIEKALLAVAEGCVGAVAAVISKGRTAGTIPEGPPAEMVARAFMAALDGVVSHLADHQPFDEEFAERATLGVLGMPPMPATL